MGLKIGTLREIGAKKGDVVTFDEKVQYRFTVEWIDGDTVYGTAHDGVREFADNWSIIATNNWRIVSPDAPTGPVRTVTRTTREIVPGEYNGLDVGRAVNGTVFLAMPIANHCQESIDALIANLTAIRDALEDS